eukprot:jgi/Bigna1/79077/fgenesh1_pg.59_\
MIDPITGLPLEEEISPGEEDQHPLFVSPSPAGDESYGVAEGNVGADSTVQDSSDGEEEFGGGGFCVSDDDNADDDDAAAAAAAEASNDSETRVVKNSPDSMQVSADRGIGSATGPTETTAAGNGEEARGVESDDGDLCGLTDDEGGEVKIGAAKVPAAKSDGGEDDESDEGGGFCCTLTDDEENEAKGDEKKGSPREVGGPGDEYHRGREREQHAADSLKEGATSSQVAETNHSAILQEAEEARRMSFGGALLMNEGGVGRGAGGFVAEDAAAKKRKEGKEGGGGGGARGGGVAQDAADGKIGSDHIEVVDDDEKEDR